ncbi:MAG: cation efflux system protein [Candidatus Binatia bacterium]|nr:MAG: cation efflux system protein [Candidatus Binatia bacterium]
MGLSNARATRSHGSPRELLTLSPTTAILRLALPTMSVMVAAAVSNILYTYYVSRLGPEALAAVSLVFPITLIAITAVGGGLGAGTASAISRALGRGQLGLANRIAGEGFKLSVISGLVFGGVVCATAAPVFTLLGGRGVVLDQAVAFARVLFGGAAISFAAAILDNILRAAGDSRTPAAWATASLVLQLFLTPAFMFWLDWGLLGAAFATLAAQLFTVLPRLYTLTLRQGRLGLRLQFSGGGYESAVEILRVATPSALSTFSNYVGLLVLTGVVARFGDRYLAAYGLGTRLDFVLLSLNYGFAVAVLTLVGMAVGASELQRAQRYVLHAGLLTGTTLGLLAVLLTLYPNLWLARFTRDPEVLAVGRDYLHWVAPTYPFVGWSMLCGFAFQATGRASLPMFWTLARVSLVVAAALVCVRVLNLPAWTIFACVAAGNVSSAIVLGWLLMRNLEPLRRPAAHVGHSFSSNPP